MRRNTLRGGWAIALALLFTATTALAEFVTTATPIHPSGTNALIDAPSELHIRNIGGSDGAGLCVGTSTEVGARWQSIPQMDGFQKWLARRPGGSYPDMLARDLKTFAAGKGYVVPPHIQHTGGDIEFLRLAIKTRRMVSMTYAGMDDFYGRNGVIAHMVNGAHIDDKYGAIIDNNQPGKWRWMSDTQLINRWLGKTDDGRNLRVGGGWLVVWLTSPPPPVDVLSKDYVPARPVVVPPITFEQEMEENGINPENGAELAPGQVGEGNLFPNGYDPNMLPPKMQYWIDGVPVDRPKALEQLKRFGSEFTDDSGKAFLSFVSDDDKVRDVIRDAVKPYADKLHVQIFKSTSWVAQQRLKAGAVVAQLPADKGGKTVFSAKEITAENVVLGAKAALGIVDPPPVQPSPTPPVMPTPVKPDVPSPSTPDKAPDVPAPSPPARLPVWQIIAAIFAAWIVLKRKV